MFWGVDKHVPGWVKTLSTEELIEAMEVRVNGTVMNTTGLLVYSN